MIRLLFVLTLVSGLAVWGCSEEKATANESAEQAPKKEAPAPQPAQNTAKYLPSIATDTIQYLVDNCDYIDYVFFELPISMSIQEKQAIVYHLTHIGAQPARQLPQCKPIGRIFYQVKGENVLEANLYFSQGCTYYEFMDGNTPYAGNLMTKEGGQYLNNILSQATQQGGNQ